MSSKSVLRYPGGKTRAVKTIVEYIPHDITKIVSPFFGGGSIEIYLASTGIKVIGYDVFKPLVDFWQILLSSSDVLADRVQLYLPLKKKRFYEIQSKIYETDDKIERAAMFYVLNRASYSGSTLSGGMSPKHPRFTQSSIDRLRKFTAPNLTVRCGDFKDTIKSHSEFMYLDPPYYKIGSHLYGKNGDTHKSFEHEKLFDMLQKRSNWLLSYNNHPFIRDMYKDFPMIETSWTYGMSKDKKREKTELLIFGGKEMTDGNIRNRHFDINKPKWEKPFEDGTKGACWCCKHLFYDETTYRYYCFFDRKERSISEYKNQDCTFDPPKFHCIESDGETFMIRGKDGRIRRYA